MVPHIVHDPNVLESSDWYHAIIMSERVASLRGIPPESLKVESTNELIRQRMQRWSSQYPHTRGTYLAQCLVTHKVSSETFLHILGEPIEAVRNRLVATPVWLRNLILGFSRAASSNPILLNEISDGHKTILFLNIIEPLIRQARDRLREGVKSLFQEVSAPFFAAEAFEDALLANLLKHLLQIVNPTLVLELNVARLQGLLEGDTHEERFQSFLARLRQPDIALAILREYPTLARQVMVCLDNWVTYSLEFLDHLCADWQDLCANFCSGENPGVLVSVDDSQGDRHRQGRSVMIVKFSSGLQVVYKPRPVAIAEHFQELLNWLNDRGARPPLRTLKILDRDTYGWVEFISPQDCTSVNEVQHFYECQGQYLALLYVLEATDFHYENLIADGEHPVLIDLETLFQPHIGRKDLEQADQETITIYSNSVLRVGLLPQRMFANAQADGIDLSGLGAAAGQPLPYPVFQWEAIGSDEMRLTQRQQQSKGGRNRPTLNGAEIDPLDYAEPITRGFTKMYRLLLQYRAELLSDDGQLARFASDTVRVILRPTLTYALLLRSSFHPDALRDGLDRDVMFDLLWVNTERFPHLAKIFPAEREDLENGDIPIFTTHPGSYSLWSSSGREIADIFDETSMSLVHRRLQRLSETDLQQQLWFIRASLATTAVGQDRGQWPTYRPSEPRVEASHQQLLASAQAIGDRLESLALHSERGVSWIGLTLTAKDHWSLVPLGFDFYGGLSGVAFFLAYLGTISKEERYTALARTTLTTIQEHLRARPLQTFPIGAFDGLGGITYLLTHLAVLWNEPELLVEANRITETLYTLITYDNKFDVTSGSAGCIMVLKALHHVLPAKQILSTAIKCGDHLLQHGQPLRNGVAWPPYFPAKGPLTGLAHGASGIAWALLELAELSGEKRFKKLALEAFKYEEALFSRERGNWPDLRERNDSGQSGDNGHQIFVAGWCHGAPGIALTRLRSLRFVDNAQIRTEIDAGLSTTLSEGFGGTHSLCHGDLGNLEVLLQASEMPDGMQWRAQVNRIAAIILASARDNGWFCGVPLGVETPGLMTGLAGIGYELLRLAEATNIPSILVLEPPQA